MPGAPEPKVWTPAEWGAAPPKRRPELTGVFDRTILHGTAGHHQEIENPRDESRAEFFRYCRDVQAFHMRPPPRGRGWNDSGQNFTIGRNGLIATGRRYSLAAARVGISVVAAHCPGQNDRPGIELEHAGNEPPTSAQLTAYVHLVAWLFSRAGARPTEIYPHRLYYATACPTSSLVGHLSALRASVASRLDHYGRHPASAVERARFRARYYAHLV